MPDGRSAGRSAALASPARSPPSTTPRRYRRRPAVPTRSQGRHYARTVPDGQDHDHLHDAEELHTTVSHRLRAAGLRYTRSRRQVGDGLAGADRPLTIPDILDQAE